MTQTKSGFLIYGANGYSGQLIVEESVALGLKPILAGRNQIEVERIAKSHNLEARAFDLTNLEELKLKIGDVKAVLNAAGPFSKTHAPVVNACLEVKTHYLDITGEIEVFESIFSRDKEAKNAGVALIPGVGFDVIPTDCLAARLAKELPGAHELSLAFSSSGKISHGTLVTMIEQVGKPSVCRRDGKIVSGVVEKTQKTINFGSGDRPTMSIPWGDVSTAYHSTGIPNITVYMALPGKSKWQARLIPVMQKFVGFKPVRVAAKAAADILVTGPDEHARQQAKTSLWGEVISRSGETVIGSYTMGDGYSFTAKASLAAVQRLLNKPDLCGALTPSKAFGAEFFGEIEPKAWATLKIDRK